MKRQILFRGQKPRSKIWVEGDLISTGIMKGIATSALEVFPFQKDTLSQYINRTDKNKKKVFEGDIIRYSGKDNDGTYGHDDFIIEWKDEEFSLCWTARCLKCSEQLFDMFPQEDFSAHIEVIGNRWDNPELLGVV